MRWDDLQLLADIDRFEESELGSVSGGLTLLQRLVAGNSVDADQAHVAFAHELLLAREAGLLTFERRGIFGAKADQDPWIWLQEIADIRLTVAGRDRARGRVVMQPLPDPNLDDGRLIASLTLEAAANEIGRSYTATQLPRFLADSGISKNYLIVEGQTKAGYVLAVFEALLEGGSSSRRLLRRFMGEWLDGKLQTGPSNDLRRHILIQLRKQGWVVRDSELAIAGDATGSRKQALPPYQGVPDWLFPSLIEWIDGSLKLVDEVSGEVFYRDDLLHSLERVLHIRLDWTGQWADDQAARAYGDLQERLEATPELCLDVLGFILGLLPESADDAVARLRGFLSEAGSIWTVSSSFPFRLEKRVENSLHEVAGLAMQPGNRAAELLREAWGHCFGRSPQPGMAYREAVRAVEAAAKPVVLPRNDRATLGTMIAALADAPSKWELAVSPVPGLLPVDCLIAICKLLWRGQTDRHGTDDEAVPLHVDGSQAELAVTLAAVLVHWFARGLVRPSS